MDVMLNDAFRYEESNVMDRPNLNAISFYNLQEATQQPLYEDCSTHCEFVAAMRLLSIKPDQNMSNRCFDDVLHLMQETTPTSNCIPEILML